MIPFAQFPANWRLPLHWVEVDPSQAGRPTQRQAALLVGTKTAAGLAVTDRIIDISSVAQAEQWFGAGSMLHRMVDIFLRNNAAHELLCVGVAEPAAGVAAAGTITVTTPATAAGTLDLYVAGQNIDVGILENELVGAIATKIRDAINAKTDLPVVASGTAATVTVTCKWKGLTGNDIWMADTLDGYYGGERLPRGLVLTYANNGFLMGGTGSPDTTGAIANLGDEDYEYVGLPFTDSTNLGLWETEYGFSDSGRWGWMRQSYGHIFSAKRDSYSNHMTLGPADNSGVISIIALESVPTCPPWEWTAAYTARAARSLLNDPARPLQTLEFEGIRLNVKQQRWGKMELNNLAGVGWATYSTSGSNKPMIMRESTRYQKNVYGQPDDAYELVTTLATLSWLFRRQKHRITSRFPRHKLANDGTRFDAGSAIVTPKVIKAELIADYREAEALGMVENTRLFKDHLIVERNTSNPNRIDVLYPPDVINQLRVMAVLAQFRLQFSRTFDDGLAA